MPDRAEKAQPETEKTAEVEGHRQPMQGQQQAAQPRAADAIEMPDQKMQARQDEAMGPEVAGHQQMPAAGRAAMPQDQEKAQDENLMR